MSDVIFAPVSNKPTPEIIKKLIKKEDYLDDVEKGDYVGIKLHVGEYGNRSHIKPEIVKVIVDELKRRGAKPFLFDCNSLYRGMRWNGLDHIRNASMNGFTTEAIGAPFIVGDGIRGMDEMDIGMKDYTQSARVGKIIEDIDYLFVLSHYKFHELFGYAGAIKNIGMGMASRRGKLFLHSDIRPDVIASKCVGCSACMITCPSKAITIKHDIAQLNKDACIGCGVCIVTCKFGAIEFEWTNNWESIIKTLHYTKAITDNIGKCTYLNVLTDITPHCDCYGYTKGFVVPDIGFTFSKDIVSIDAASADLIEKAEPLEDVIWKRKELAAKDKVKALLDIDIDMNEFFSKAESIGLGSKKYNLKEIK